MTTRQKVKPLNFTQEQIKVGIMADKAARAQKKADRKAAKEAEAKEQNLDAAQRELDARAAEGEPVDHLRVNPITAHIERTEPTPEEAAAHEAENAANYRAALRVDAQAMGCETEEAIEAYIAEQLGPVDDAPKIGGYQGPMLALRKAARHYVRGIHCGDPLAALLDGMARADVVSCLGTFLLKEGITTAQNPYLHLNEGQQSMNLRNKFRGAVKNGFVSHVALVAHIAAMGKRVVAAEPTGDSDDFNESGDEGEGDDD
jgi:hypothetical protein